MKDVEFRWVWQDKIFTDQYGVQYATREKTLEYRKYHESMRQWIWSGWIPVPEVKS
jgi:hypothetical protein